MCVRVCVRVCVRERERDTSQIVKGDVFGRTV